MTGRKLLALIGVTCLAMGLLVAPASAVERGNIVMGDASMPDPESGTDGPDQDADLISGQAASWYTDSLGAGGQPDEGKVFAVGDLQYPSGCLEDFNDYWTQDWNWGRDLWEDTTPGVGGRKKADDNLVEVIGNHEYHDSPNNDEKVQPEVCGDGDPTPPGQTPTGDSTNFAEDVYGAGYRDYFGYTVSETEQLYYQLVQQVVSSTYHNSCDPEWPIPVGDPGNPTAGPGCHVVKHRMYIVDGTRCTPNFEDTGAAAGDCTSGGTQYEWFADKVDENWDDPVERCQHAFVHQAWFSNGEAHGGYVDGSGDKGNALQDLYRLLDDGGGVDLMFGAHDHTYERFGAIDADGNTGGGVSTTNAPRVFVGGIGGSEVREFDINQNGTDTWDWGPKFQSGDQGGGTGGINNSFDPNAGSDIEVDGGYLRFVIKGEALPNTGPLPDARYYTQYAAYDGGTNAAGTVVDSLPALAPNSSSKCENPATGEDPLAA